MDGCAQVHIGQGSGAVGSEQCEDGEGSRLSVHLEPRPPVSWKQTPRL